MGRKKFIGDRTMVRLREGTIDRVKRILNPGEKQSEFYREAIEGALAKREESLRRK